MGNRVERRSGAATVASDSRAPTKFCGRFLPATAQASSLMRAKDPGA
jgi:hypothetical protein